MNYLFLLIFFAITSCGIYQGDQGTYSENFNTQELYSLEIHTDGSSIEDGFDATLEEVLHLISQNGFAYAYPETFGEFSGSTIATYMDVARGGFFETVPDSYPDDAWYHYDDTSCEYACQITEYFYWALTSILGAQNYTDGIASRYDEISDEWELNTVQKMQDRDPNMYDLMSSSDYLLPSILPSGNYTQSSTINISITDSLPSELDDIAPYFTRYASVFGIHIVATDQVQDDRILHAAHVLAEYLDNDQDGNVDNTLVLEKMLERNSVLAIALDSDQMDSIFNQVD
ncbi:MAG: hypothetical protein VXX85_07700 [Candidatus Margulisiibacteriota bacterium]|nr:hypothetical protein [Candidatus Margulisiibacteriota bacterium]